jgi:general secretion pathway protein K
MELELNSLRIDKLKCSYLAMEGINCAVSILAQDENEFDGLNEPWNVHPSFEKELLSKGVSYTIIDEDSKVSINQAPHEQLKGLLDIEDEIASSIIDWRDEDGELNPGGAEDTYYEGLENPYQCKDNLFDFVSELLYVKGITPDIFYGQEESHKMGIRDAVTLWTDGLININTAPIEVLMSIPDMRIGLAQSIVQYRQGPDSQDGTGDDNPFEDMEELKGVPGISLGEHSQISGYLKTTSKIFRITSQASLPYSRLKSTIITIVERDKDNKIKILMWKED